MNLRAMVIDSESSYQFCPVQTRVQAVPQLQCGHTQCPSLSDSVWQSTLWLWHDHVFFECWYKEGAPVGLRGMVMGQVSPLWVQTDPFSSEAGKQLVLCLFSCVPPFFLQHKEEQWWKITAAWWSHGHRSRSLLWLMISITSKKGILMF